MTMNQSQDPFCSEHIYDVSRFIDEYNLQPGFDFLWILGIFGNLVNMWVFNHKNMEHPINSILWWLSATDILELVSIALYQWCIRWTYFLSFYSILLQSSLQSYYITLLLQFSIFLIQAFHSITIGLNITLAFWRYLAIAHPFQNKFQCDRHMVKRTVTWLYVLSFGIYLPVLYALKVIKVEHPICGTFYIIRIRDAANWTFRGSNDDFINGIVFVCGVCLRIVPFLALTTIIIMMSFALLKTIQSRKNLGLSASHLTEQQKRINQINVTVITIMLMFFITEIPIGIGSISLVSFQLWSSDCERMLAEIQLLTLLVNCSYNILCYLMTSTQYRSTLKLLLRKCASNTYCSPYSELTISQLPADTELSHL